MAAGKPTSKPVSGSRAARLAQTQLWIGFAVTAAIAVLQALGFTRRMEYPLDDLRMKMFNIFTPPPSPHVAVVAIDDASIETIGKWPWPRQYLGIAIRELKRGGASVVALDLLHDDPQEILFSGDPADPASIRAVDNDALLAEAIAYNGRVVQGMSFNYVDPAKLRERQEAEAEQGIHRSLFEDVLRKVAENPAATEEDLLEILHPGLPLFGPHREDMARNLRRARTLIGIGHTSGLAATKDVARWPLSNDPRPPVPRIAEASAAVASVSFGGGDPDGAVRRIPLWVQSHTRLFPSLGLASAALHLGVPLQSLRPGIDQTQMLLSSGRRLIIPTHSAALYEILEQGVLDGMMHIVWPRGGWSGWERQFAVEDPPGSGRFQRGEIRLARLLDPDLVIIPNIRSNIADLDVASEVLSAGLGIGDWTSYAPRAAELASLRPDETRWRELHALQKAAWLRMVKEAGEMLEQVRGDPSFDPETMSDEERAAVQALENASNLAPRQIDEIDNGLANLDRWWKEELPARVGNRVCFIGWTATGSLADFVSTAADSSRTPGVLVHAAVTNAILNSVERSQFLSLAPWWFNLAALIALGIIGTIIGVRLGVVQSPIVLLLALVVWFTVDGIVFWDWRNMIVAEAAPMAAALASWLAVILHRLLVEQRSRRQTEARFRSYVSPDVVDILVNNPEMDSMRPQKRELTIFFSDIAGWTTITERIGTEGIAAFLATYLKAMTDILQENRATIDKYLGDGIMAFWGAPIEDPDHAAHAVKACLLMQEKLRQMNEAGEFGNAGQIGVRIGLASGEVNVGDFGNPPHKSAYTVIGDSANLSARLESANKQFGSKILMTERTRLLAGMNDGVRMIGRVVVKGKTEPETLWEPIGDMKPKGEKTADWIRLTNEAVQAYIDGDFDRATPLFDRLESEFDDGELAARYRDSMAAVRERGGPEPGFDGTIVLTEK